MKNSLTPLFITLVSLCLLSSCAPSNQPVTGVANKLSVETTRDTLTLFDHARNRKVPVAVYTTLPQATARQPVVLLSHGYNFNRPGSYLLYSSIAEKLASEGYFVVSIQHELPTDDLIPSTGIPQVVRRPFWERGADNIFFVLQYLQQSTPRLDFNRVTLIGHSNGGDMVALFPQKYPHRVAKIITLDNRRMALPKTKNLQVYSLRSSDQTADEGVLPTLQEQNRWGMVILPLPHTIHNDMDDHATAAQRQEINQHLLNFLNK